VRSLELRPADVMLEKRVQRWEVAGLMPGHKDGKDSKKSQGHLER
jgi:hypothetical protein